MEKNGNRLLDKNILEDRVVILDVDGNVIEYPVYSSGQHQECYESFAREKGYEFCGFRYLVSKGNGVFAVGNKMLVVSLPENLNELQLYMLDNIENWLSKVQYIEIEKVNETERVVFSCTSHDVIKTFDDVIQSYYSKKSKSK